MKGIEYIQRAEEDAGHVRGRLRRADPKQDSALRPVERHVLPESLIYIFQNDSSFGKNTYEACPAARIDGPGLHEEFVEMYYSIVPLVEPGYLSSTSS
jgi:hypothetical protein